MAKKERLSPVEMMAGQRGITLAQETSRRLEELEQERIEEDKAAGIAPVVIETSALDEPEIEPEPAPPNDPPPEIKKPIAKVDDFCYRAMRDFRTTILGSIHSFKAGQVVSDSGLISILIQQGCPVEMINTLQTVLCPECKHHFDIPTGVGPKK